MYVNVAVDNKSNHLDMLFTYSADGYGIKAGDKVKIPFRNKTRAGYVVELIESPDIEADKIKPIISVEEGVSLTPEGINTALWLRRRYAVRYYEALNLFGAPLPARKRGTPKNPYGDLEPKYFLPDKLTLEQKNAAEIIKKSIAEEKNDIFLIHGVTSSGKTEVYFEAMEECLKIGKTAIMLVPEISLTKQVIERVAGRFGKEKIAVLHSGLTARERTDEWERIRKGEAHIVIGARMGVFAPLENICVIVLDEEHESTYKSDMTPKYDTVEVAAKRQMTNKGVLLLGSATPSVSSYERAKKGIYRLIELKERYNGTPLPKVELIDMRKELKSGNTSIFSSALKNSIGDALKNREQIILLQNRRGYSNFVSCRECGAVMKCPSCELSLVYHKKTNRMLCHYCGRGYAVPKTCPSCNSRYIKYFGIGTEQVEEAVKSTFPEAKVERLDIDAISDRTELDRILNNFSKRETDILVGTQLVAKGLDFDNVGVVGVISADTSLNLPDYRAEERTFQLITQVAGRSGRGDKRGIVIVQSYEPDNFALKTAKEHDYSAFFEKEAGIREIMEYPPFGDIIMVNFTSTDEKSAMDVAEECRNYFINAVGSENQKRVLSPKNASNFKTEDAFRTCLIIKAPQGKRNEWVFYIDEFRNVSIKTKPEVTINIDVNPYSVF